MSSLRRPPELLWGQWRHLRDWWPKVKRWQPFQYLDSLWKSRIRGLSLSQCSYLGFCWAQKLWLSDPAGTCGWFCCLLILHGRTWWWLAAREWSLAIEVWMHPPVHLRGASLVALSRTWWARRGALHGQILELLFIIIGGLTEGNSGPFESLVLKSSSSSKCCLSALEQLTAF